jgi:hypothetical protein
MDKKAYTKLISSILFVVVVIVIFALFNFIYIEHLAKNKLSYRKEMMYNKFVSNLTNNSLDYLFLGDSHTAKGLNPKYIPISYNNGIDGGNMFMIYSELLSKHYSSKSFRTKTIVLEIDLNFFRHAATGDLPASNSLNVYTSSKNKSLLSRYNLTIFKDYLLKSFPILGHGEDFYYLGNKDLTPVSLDGYIAANGNFSKEDRVKAARIDYHNLFYNQTLINNMSLLYFNLTMQYALKNNITLVFIKYPFAKEIDDQLIENNISKDNFYAFIYGYIRDNYRRNFTVLDYYYLFYNQPEYFDDSTHLNIYGAEKLAKVVSSDLRKLNLTS